MPQSRTVCWVRRWAAAAALSLIALPGFGQTSAAAPATGATAPGTEGAAAAPDDPFKDGDAARVVLDEVVVCGEDGCDLALDSVRWKCDCYPSHARLSSVSAKVVSF